MKRNDISRLAWIAMAMAPLCALASGSDRRVDHQTRWLGVLCAALCAAALWIVCLYRWKRASEQIQERLNARLQERERIAREFHDTLLQGFQGLVLRFQAVLNTLPDDNPARKRMEQVMMRADEVLLEGRQRVRELRAEGATGTDQG